MPSSLRCPTTYIIEKGTLEVVNILFTGDILDELLHIGGMMPAKSLLEQRIQSREIPIFHVMRSCQQSALHYETRVFITVYAVGNKLVENMPVTGIYWFRHFYGE